MILLTLLLLFPIFTHCSWDSPLGVAIQTGKLEEASKLIKEGANLNETPHIPILQVAAGNSAALHIVVELINAGAPVKDHPPEAFEPLMFTLCSNDNGIEAAAVLLAAGANPHRCNNEGDCFSKHTNHYETALELSKQCTRPLYPTESLLAAITVALKPTIPIVDLCAIIRDYAAVQIVCLPPPNWAKIIDYGYEHVAQAALMEYPDSIDDALEAAKHRAAQIKFTYPKIGQLITAAAAARNKKLCAK